MTNCVHLAAYRALISTYPRAFRDNYGEDLVSTFGLQLAALGAMRCWLRALNDLVITIPAQHLEAHMKHLSAAHVSTACFAFAIGTFFAAAATGTSLYGLIFLSISAIAVVIAVLSRKATKPALKLENSRSWKKFLTAGSVLLVVLIAAINLPPNNGKELSSVAWSLMMLALLTSFTLIGAGIVIGATRLARNNDHAHSDER